jgi:N-acetylglucosamine kinase-like BadF-type ATPase
MTLICDCGSTKAEWVVLNDGNVVKRFITNGFNPNFTDGETIKSIISEAKDVVDNEEVSRVFFYGSGCGSEANKIKVSMLFAMVFKINDIEVFPDTLGACHALFGNNPGIACILGTGSNACVYDGEKITETVASLGFMIGDEGSGCHIGKRIVHDYFLGLMPEDLRKKFDEKYHLDRETFLKRVYQGEQPSRFLADFTKFAAENVDNQYIKTIVGDCFEQFISSSIPYGSARNYVGFVGSIAFIFQDILLQHLANHNIKCSKILKNPMDGLIEYYKSL